MNRLPSREAKSQAAWAPGRSDQRTHDEEPRATGRGSCLAETFCGQEPSQTVELETKESAAVEKLVV